MNETKKFMPVQLTAKNILTFAIPALIGAFIFLCPMSANGTSGIVVGIILTTVSNAIISYTPSIVVALMCITSIIMILARVFKPNFICKNQMLSSLFLPKPFEFILSIIGSLLGVVVLFQLFSEKIYSEDTGGTILELVANIKVWFIVASLFIPFLLDFGLMEFIGTLARKIARPMLHIPGRSMVNVITSFVGDQNLGVMVTNDQYVQGQYTGREAATIACCFSATGIAYWYIISTILSVEMYFIPIVITMFATGFLASVIMVRIWPLKSIEDTYYKGQKSNTEDDCPQDMKLTTYALQMAVQKAMSFQGIKSMAIRSVKFSAQVVVSVLPIIMVIGTAGLMIATYTPIFEWLAVPFKYYLELLQIPEAASAAPATVAGFADMLIPSLIAAKITSAKTRFIICVLSLSQIIYMSEVGPILLMSKIPVNFVKLVEIFVVKTIIALPIITFMATIFGIPA